MTLCVAAWLPLVIYVMVLKPLSLTLPEKSQERKSVTVFYPCDFFFMFFFSLQPPWPSLKDCNAYIRAVLAQRHITKCPESGQCVRVFEFVTPSRAISM